MGQSRRSRYQPKRGRGCLLLSAAVLSALAGCESGPGGRLQGDPMLGIHSPAAPVPAPNAPSNPAALASSGPLPPMPATYTTPGTAPVAGGETATPENPRDLRVTGDAVSPASLAGSGAARGAAPGITVGNPEPVQPGAVSNLAAPPSASRVSTPPTTPATSTGSAATIQTLEDAQRYLKQHGVNWQRLSDEEGEWNFACGIPNPSNAHLSKRYQTNRGFPDALAAIRAVITEIEQTPR